MLVESTVIESFLIPSDLNNPTTRINRFIREYADLMISTGDWYQVSSVNPQGSNILLACSYLSTFTMRLYQWYGNFAYSLTFAGTSTLNVSNGTLSVAEGVYTIKTVSNSFFKQTFLTANSAFGYCLILLDDSQLLGDVSSFFNVTAWTKFPTATISISQDFRVSKADYTGDIVLSPVAFIHTSSGKYLFPKMQDKLYYSGGNTLQEGAVYVDDTGKRFYAIRSNYLMPD